MMANQSATVRSMRAEDNGFTPRRGFEPFEASQAERSIVQRFLEVACGQGDARAVVMGKVVVTYAELMASASSIGTALRDRLGGHTGPVALEFPSGVAAIEALLGVLFSGRSYFFLPPELRTTASDDLVAAARPAALIVADQPTPAFERSEPSISCSSIAIGDLKRGTHGYERPEDFAAPGDLACLFATSGTTGTAKLVGLSHRAVLFDTGRQNNDLCMGPDDRIDLLAHPSFSSSLASIFTALLTGGELHIPDTADRLGNLGAWLTASGITISTMTVSALRALCATLPPGGGPRSLRLLSVGGEPMFSNDVALFRAAFPSSCVLQNAMASTETRTYAQYFVPRESQPDGATPIGWPVFGKDVVVLGQDGFPVGKGQPGEIAVRSHYLANGYVNSPSLTGKRFLQQPDGSVLFLTGDLGRFREDGCLMFHGRVDSMVKIRGYRVEPGAVESVLLCDPRVRHAAVVTRETSAGEPYLAAYVVPDPQFPATPGQLLEAVASRLPEYSVPSALELVESLPVTRNGKIDYRSLKERRIEGLRISRDSSNAGMAAALLQVWSDVLGRTDITADDSFFECGGNSLEAIRLQVQIYRQFGVDPPLEVLVRNPSANALAEWLNDRHGSASGGAALVPLNQGDMDEIPLFCVPGIGGETSEFWPLAKRLGDRPVYGLRITDGYHGQHPSIETVASECLRKIDTVISPDTSVFLCGHSFGAIVAFEIAHQLEATRRPLGLLAIIDLPLNPGRRRWWQCARDVFRNLPAWLWYDAIETDWRTLSARIRGKLAVIGRQIHPISRSENGANEPDFCAYFGKRDVPNEMKARLMARLDAVERYRLRPLAETIVLFRARAQALFGRSDRHLGWESFASAVVVRDVPGHHDSCVAEPHVRRMAELLAARIDSVQHTCRNPQDALPCPG